MILDNKQVEHIQRLCCWMNDRALRKAVDDLVETMEHYKTKYQSTSDFVKDGRQS